MRSLYFVIIGAQFPVVGQREVYFGECHGVELVDTIASLPVQ